MGNVFASGYKCPEDSTFMNGDYFSDKAQNVKTKNPGTMEELHKKCKDVFPINFEGARLTIQKGMSTHLQVTHSLIMSSIMPSGYRFGGTYVGMKQFGPTEAYPVIAGDMDPQGNFNAHFVYKLTDNLLTRLQAQAQEGNVSSQFITDYRGGNFTTSVTFVNPNPIACTGIVVGHYLQNVGRNIDMGIELAYQRSLQFPANQTAVTSFAARYTGDDFTISGTAGMSGFNLCYYQKASHQIQLGVELESNRMSQVRTSFGFQADIPKADLVFKGMMDTNWNVGATLEKKLLPMPFLLSISGMLNHQKNIFSLGIGFITG